MLAVILAFTVDPENRLLAILGSLAFGAMLAFIVPKGIRAESAKTIEVYIDRGVAFTMGTQGIRLPDPAGGARDLPWNRVRLHLTDSENPGDDPSSIRLVADGESRSYLSRALTPDVSTIREAEGRLHG